MATALLPLVLQHKMSQTSLKKQSYSLQTLLQGGNQQKTSKVSQAKRLFQMVFTLLPRLTARMALSLTVCLTKMETKLLRAILGLQCLMSPLRMLLVGQRLLQKLQKICFFLVLTKLQTTKLLLVLATWLVKLLTTFVQEMLLKECLLKNLQSARMKLLKHLKREPLEKSLKVLKMTLLQPQMLLSKKIRALTLKNKINQLLNFLLKILLFLEVPTKQTLMNTLLKVALTKKAKTTLTTLSSWLKSSTLKYLLLHYKTLSLVKIQIV